MNFRDRIVELRRVPASSLRRNPKNWRTHPSGQREGLKSILQSVGVADAALARQLDDGSLELIDGHLRGDLIDIIPVLVLDVNEEEADLLLATIDPLAGMAGCDSDKLDSLIASIKSESQSVDELLASIKGSGERAEKSLKEARRSHKSTATDSYADPSTEFREPGVVHQYTLIFDDREQLDNWYNFLKWLKTNVEGETIGDRLTTFVNEAT